MGILYLAFTWTGIPQLAGLVEGIIYLTQSRESFDAKFNGVRGRYVILGTTTEEESEQLDALRQRGAIGAEEYLEKKIALLKRMQRENG